MKICAISFSGINHIGFKASYTTNKDIEELLDNSFLDGKKRSTPEEVRTITLKTEQMRKEYNMKPEDNEPFVDALDKMLSYKKYPPIGEKLYLSTEDIIALLSIKSGDDRYRFNRWLLSYFDMRKDLSGKDVLKIKQASAGNTACGDAINAMLTINDNKGKFMHSIDDICEILKFADVKTGSHGLYNIINARIYDINLNERRFLKKDELIKILSENGKNLKISSSPSGLKVSEQGISKNYEITEKGIELASVEKTEFKPTDICKTKRIFSDGRQVFCVSKKIDSVIQNSFSAVYDSDGNRLYYEQVKPAKDYPELYLINRTDKTTTATANITRDANSPDIYSYKRTFVSPQGIATNQIVVNKPDKLNSFYKITDAEGKTLFLQTRSIKTLKANRTQSMLNGKIYDMLFYDNKILVKENGLDSVVLDEKLLDKRLMSLYKKLPGDILMLIKKLGVKVRLAKTTNDCLYHDEKIIQTVDDTGIFMHELGHAVDALMMSEYSKELGKIYRREFYELSKNGNELSVLSLSKFQKLHELVAESFQLFSGELISPKFAQDLGLRMFNMPRFFPESMAFLAKQFVKRGII